MNHFTRRNLLRGVGACVALPFMESLLPAGTKTPAKPPLRMGIFTVTGGTVNESWVPQEQGTLGKLPSILRALEPHKSEILVLSNLSQSGRSENVNAHQHCAYMHLTAADKVSSENNKPVTQVEAEKGKFVVAESVDQRAARLVAKESLLPSLEIGYAGGETQFSYRENGSNVPFEKDPLLVFERMFKGRSLIAPNWNRRHAAQAPSAANPAAVETYDKQVVDIVLEDAKRLQKALGQSDRQKLADYLAAIDSIERRISHVQNRLALEAADVADPGPSRPAKPAQLPADRAAANRMAQLVGRSPQVHAEYIRIMAELMVLAFQTDTTRVCTVGVGSDEAMFPGVVTVGSEYHMHTLEHQGNANRIEEADPISREGCRQVHAWYTQLFAHMVERLRNIDEGGSSLLDNSMILYTSYMANGGHGTHDYPVLLAGRAGGTLKPGRHVAYQKDTPVANLYVEMLARMGDTRGEFGNSRTSPKAAYEGRLPELV
jgi:hypothetical protein